MSTDYPRTQARFNRPSSVDVDTAKHQMRVTAAHARGTLLEGFQSPQHAGQLLRNSFLDHYKLKPGEVVAGYWPSSHEIDVRPLLNFLAERGHPIAMPVVVNKQQAMRFRRWSPGVQMVPGRFGIPVPPDTLPEVRPEVVLVPLLAFDRTGRRLGRGAGLYDRTLQMLRSTSGHVVAIGIAFAGQEMAHVPHDVHDQRLDWVITERDAFSTRTCENPLAAFGALNVYHRRP